MADKKLNALNVVNNAKYAYLEDANGNQVKMEMSTLASVVGELQVKGNMLLPVKFRPAAIWTSVYCKAVIYLSGTVAALEFAFTRRSDKLDVNIYAKRSLGVSTISLKTDGYYLYISGGEVGNTRIALDCIDHKGSKALEVQAISQDEYTALTGLTDITIQS